LLYLIGAFLLFNRLIAVISKFYRLERDISISDKADEPKSKCSAIFDQQEDAVTILVAAPAIILRLLRFCSLSSNALPTVSLSRKINDRSEQTYGNLMRPVNLLLFAPCAQMHWYPEERTLSNLLYELEFDMGHIYQLAKILRGNDASTQSLLPTSRY